MANESFTPEQRQVLLDMRAEGYLFKDIALHFAAEYDLHKTAENIGATYRYITKDAPNKETATSFIESRRKTKQNTDLRRKQNILMDEQVLYGDILKELKKELHKLEIPLVPVSSYEPSVDVEEATLVLSDLHTGLKTKIHNKEIAERKLQEIVGHFIKKCIKDKPKKIILACIGDFIEGTGMHHGQEYSTDLMLGEQVSECLRLLWTYVYKPLIELGIPVFSVVVAGNHDRPTKNKQCNDIGKAYLSRPIFDSIVMLCEQYEQMTFHLEDGVYCVINGCLYEHGDFAKGLLSIKGSLAHMAVRQGQCGQKVERFIHGHLHTEAIFNNGSIISNNTLGAGNDFGEAIGFNTKRSSQAYRFEYSNGHVEAGYFSA